MFQGTLLFSQAIIDRLILARYSDAEDKLQLAYLIMTEMRNWMYLTNIICEKGYLEIARRHSAHPILTEIEQISAQTGITYDEETQQHIDGLKKAQKTFEKREYHQLFRGQLTEDIPPPIRHWLVENKKLSAIDRNV
ncbi:hypothetical protein ACFL27_08490 [candidate division CSSED10-310 bacterium]|uniref:Nucleotidyltransferase n=1 Tax=candidate division CSSED10-310 bacterium TaxID=2855610 RepID=A0ABV6YVL3_UNCC1